MSSLKFNGKDAWFVTPDNKYGLATYAMKNITHGDFSFLVDVQVDWDSMNPDDLSREGGIIIKNGMHLGIAAYTPKKDTYFIKSTIWAKKENETECKAYDIQFKSTDVINGETGRYNIGLTYNQEDKKFGVFCNGEWIDMEFEGELMDYTNSWLWFGAANPLESCPQEFRHFFNGELFFAGVYSKALNRVEIENIFANQTNVDKSLNPVAIFDFKRQTPYKALDISGVGNNLIMFDTEWMDSI
jgi:hypothetical protein